MDEAAGSDTPQPPPSEQSDPHGPPPAAGEQVVEAYPVLAEIVNVERRPPASLPVVQAAAFAATGFVAGAATVALLRRAGSRRLLRERLERAALRELGDGGERVRQTAQPAPGPTYIIGVRLISRG
jgi:hypothetical protein